MHKYIENNSMFVIHKPHTLIITVKGPQVHVLV